MQTQVLDAYSPEAVALAASLFSRGELVGFPTETVYGLGADALNRQAVLSIFAAKGRPADNPLIVHIWHRDQMRGLCTIPDGAESLMDAFWPGPLTMLFPRTNRIPDEVTDLFDLFRDIDIRRCDAFRFNTGNCLLINSHYLSPFSSVCTVYSFFFLAFSFCSGVMLLR